MDLHTSPRWFLKANVMGPNRNLVKKLKQVRDVLVVLVDEIISMVESCGSV